jgi:hypothetical protein
MGDPVLESPTSDWTIPLLRADKTLYEAKMVDAIEWFIKTLIKNQ